MIYLFCILLIAVVTVLLATKESVAEAQIEAVNAFIESQKPPSAEQRIKQLTKRHALEIAELRAEIENLKS